MLSCSSRTRFRTAVAIVPGMQVKGMTFTMPETPRCDIVDGLAHGKNRLSFKGVMDIRPGASQGLPDARLVQAPEAAVEPAQKPTLVPALNMPGQICLEQAPSRTGSSSPTPWRSSLI